MKNAKPNSWVVNVILECNFVEVIQKMWRRDVCPELLEQNEKLPEHVAAALMVIYDALFRLKYFCIPGSVASSFEKGVYSSIIPRYHDMRTWDTRAIVIVSFTTSAIAWFNTAESPAMPSAVVTLNIPMFLATCEHCRPLTTADDDAHHRRLSVDKVHRRAGGSSRS